nr:MAG TPA: hypothetical protein [Caudoviricetes sp.]
MFIWFILENILSLQRIPLGNAPKDTKKGRGLRIVLQ